MSDRKKMKAKPEIAWAIKSSDYLVPSSIRTMRRQAIKDWCGEDYNEPWSWWRRQDCRAVKVIVKEIQS